MCVCLGVCVCLIDIPCVPGQERYGNMTRVYYREAVGALVVFDVTRASTFDAVLKWKDDLNSKVSTNCPSEEYPYNNMNATVTVMVRSVILFWFKDS